MKQMKRLGLVVSLAVVALAGSAARALPFYLPDYTLDPTTGTGFQYNHEGGIQGKHDVVIIPDGRVVANIQYYQTGNPLDFHIAHWRGDALLPTPQVEIDRPSSLASGINRYGWISGTTTPTGSDAGKPAVWRPDGTRIDLPMLPGKPYGGAAAINDSGFVAGAYDEFDGPDAWPHPVCWTPSLEIVELTNPLATSRPFGVAYLVNSSGIIAGIVYGEGGNLHAMKWDINGTATILPQTTNTGNTLTRSITTELLDDGTILGSGRVGPSGQIPCGVLWMPNGEAIELRSPNQTEQRSVIPYGINRNHHAVGWGSISGDAFAVRWSPTGDPFVLDRLPDAPSNAFEVAYDINDFNFAVGESEYGNFHSAALWKPDGDAIDLNSLVESSDEWTFVEAHSITNTGWIAGVGWFDPSELIGYYRPFSILVPFAGTYGMGDANFDESIDFADLLIVAQHYGSSTGGSVDAGDFNLDGVVDFTDLLAIAQNYENVLGDSVGLLPNGVNPTFASDWQTARAMVPEPNLVGALIGAGLLLRRRRA